MSKLLAALLAVAVVTAPQARPPAVSRVAPFFDLASLERSPFPSDRFTVPDANQITGRRVNLPMPPDCAAEASECEDRALLNHFDGFNLEPRISIPFSGAIDPASVTSAAVFLVPLGETRRKPEVIGINYRVWDPETREMSFRPDRILDEHSTYAVVVTTAVRASDGNPIAAADAYRAALKNAPDGDYGRRLTNADALARSLVRRPAEIAALSVFTTQSASYVVQRLRDAVRAAPPPRLDFRVGPAGERAVFNADDVVTLSNDAEVTAGGPLSSQPMTQGFPAMRIVPGVGTMAFGKFRAADFTIHPSGHVPVIASRTGTFTATGSADVGFNLWLPSGTPPPSGWPIAICGHGSNGSKNACFATTGVLASHGVAVIAMNAMGHGGGPRTTMTVGLKDGRSKTVAAPGLGYDADGDGTIATWEPPRAPRPNGLFYTTGMLIQTTAQVLQLVRALQGGVDVDGNGTPDLDGARIYYYGQSLGGNYGMLTFPIEPAIRAAVFTVPAGTLIYSVLLSPPYRPRLAAVLAARTPSLINEARGLTALDGMNVSAGPYYNDNLPLRDAAPLVNDVPGAAAIQRVVDRMVWVAQPTNTVAAAPWLRRAPIAAVAVRPFLVQAARSDPASTNPPFSAIVRAGAFPDRVAFYRHDLNFGADGVPQGSHQFLGAIGAPPSYSRIARSALEQIATFFESDGKTVLSPTPVGLWELPIRTLPEDTFLLPRPR
jgi:hypothetical protein